VAKYGNSLNIRQEKACIGSCSMKQLINLLRNRDYCRIRRFPLRKYSPSLSLVLNELDNVARFIFNGNNIFAISIEPSIYVKISSNNKLKFLREAFFLNMDLSSDLWERFFAKDLLCFWEKEGLLCANTDNRKHFNYRIVPYDNLYLVTSRFDRDNRDFTYLSYDSICFASFLKKRLSDLSFLGNSVLDLCCGIGIQALAISSFSRQITGVDINGKAIELAKLNAILNGVSNCNFIKSSFFEKINMQFDLIVCNPPYIHMKGADNAMIDSNGGEPFGLGATVKILSELERYLNYKGLAFIITRSPKIKGEDYLFSNLKKYLPPGLGCDYDYIADSINKITSAEKIEGISGYRNVILEVSRKDSNKFVNYSTFYRNMRAF